MLIMWKNICIYILNLVNNEIMIIHLFTQKNSKRWFPKISFRVLYTVHYQKGTYIKIIKDSFRYKTPPTVFECGTVTCIY